MKSLLFQRIASTICLTCICMLSFATIGPVRSASASAYSFQHCEGTGCDGQLPLGIFDGVCLSSAYSVKKAEDAGAEVNIMYTPECNAFFVHSQSFAAQSYLYVSIERDSPFRSYSNDISGYYSLYSRMVGNTNSVEYGAGCVGEFYCPTLRYP